MAAEQLSCHITSAIAAITHGPAPAQLHITRCQRLHFSVSPSFGPICTLLQYWMASLTAMLPVELQSNFCIVPIWQAADADIGDRDGTLGNAAFEQWPENIYVRVPGKHLPLFWIKFVLFMEIFAWNIGLFVFSIVILVTVCRMYKEIQCWSKKKKKTLSVNQQWFIYVHRSYFLVQHLTIPCCLKISHYSTWWENEVQNLKLLGFFCCFFVQLHIDTKGNAKADICHLQVRFSSDRTKRFETS